ncbi:hypothetical protein MTO96_019900 [Rhipicephalus appendiculatus]
MWTGAPRIYILRWDDPEERQGEPAAASGGQIKPGSPKPGLPVGRPAWTARPETISFHRASSSGARELMPASASPRAGCPRPSAGSAVLRGPPAKYMGVIVLACKGSRY